MQLYNRSSERPRGTFISWLNPVSGFGPQLPHKSTTEGSRWHQSAVLHQSVPADP